MTMILRINCDQPMEAGTCAAHAYGTTADPSATERTLAAAGWATYVGGEHRCPRHARSIRSAR